MRKMTRKQYLSWLQAKLYSFAHAINGKRPLSLDAAAERVVMLAAESSRRAAGIRRAEMDAEFTPSATRGRRP